MDFVVWLEGPSEERPLNEGILVLRHVRDMTHTCIEKNLRCPV